ncbi:MAG TPA: STAS domain-containing protein [Actinomycetota bacterium]|nr:STAS domain-containing protein [Actinomycetota bacterium]
MADTWGLLSVSCRKCDPRSLVLRLEGDLDIYNTRELSNHLEQAETGVEEIVIDLSGLNFIDCAGLHQLMEAAQRSKSRGGRLKLVKGPHKVHRVFALTGLDSAFDFVPAPPG